MRKAFLVDAAGRVTSGAAPVLRAEAQRVAEVKAAGLLPPNCGDAPVAPARGPVAVEAFRTWHPGIDGPGRLVPEGWLGRSTARARDVFDRLDERQVKPALTLVQVSVGRRYRTLVEWIDAGAVKLASLEGRRGGGDAASLIDARIDAGRRVDRMRQMLGDRPIMVVRRVRPSQRGERRPITARALIDAVCLGDMDPTAVLESHGWAAYGPLRRQIIEALADALDRMGGGAPRGDVRVWRSDQP